MCHSAANENQAGGCVSACLLVAGRVTDSFESLEKDPVKKRKPGMCFGPAKLLRWASVM